MKEFFLRAYDFVKSSLGRNKAGNFHGSASWNAYKWEILKQSNRGLTINGIDKISEPNSFLNSVIIAPSGAGKTTTYIIPNALNLQSSMIITDPSGEIHKSTKDTLISKFFDIRIINPNNLEKTFFYNPLARANTITEINKITTILIENAYKKDGSTSDASFWNNGAKTILNLIIQAVKTNPDPQKRNLQEARRLLLFYGQIDEARKIDKLASEIEKHLYHDENAMSELASFFATEDKVRHNFITTAKNALEIFTDPNICELTKKDTIKFEDIKTETKRPVVIFLIVPEHEIQYYSFLLNLFYTQIFNFCAFTSADTKPVFFLLDEFGNMGRLPNFETIITILRKRKCSISIILQDIKQLNAIYGQNNAEVIFGNCASKIFFSGLDLPMCQKIQEMLGKETVEHKDGDTGKRSLHGRYLMTADEIRRLPRSKIIYIFSNERPFLLPTRYYQG
jgi:type IV secretion system protein VirD4